MSMKLGSPEFRDLDVTHPEGWRLRLHSYRLLPLVSLQYEQILGLEGSQGKFKSTLNPRQKGVFALSSLACQRWRASGEC